MKRNLLLKTMLLLCALVVGTSSSWAEEATITFSSQTSGTSDSGTTYTTSNFVSSGISSSDVAFGTITCSATSKCYSGKTNYGLKLGASSDPGSFTISFSSSLTNVTKITLNRASYSDSKTATITVKNGSTTLASESTPSGSAAFSNMEISNLNITSLEGITVQSNKYCYIKSITITYDDNTPFVGDKVTFVGGTDKGTSTTQTSDAVTKSVVTISSDKAAFATAQYRMYQNSTTTISTTKGKITRIEFTPSGTSNPLSNLSLTSGSSGTYSDGKWTGCANSVSFNATAQARASEIKVYVTPTVILNGSGFASYCSSFALDLTPNDDFAAYAVKAAGSDKKNQVVFTKILGKVETKTPFVLYNPAKASKAVYLPIIEDDDAEIVDVSANNELVGTISETSTLEETGYTNFGLSGSKFVKMKEGTVKANKAYLHVDDNCIDTSGGAKALTIVFNDATTGINGVEEIAPVVTKIRKVVKNGRLVIETLNGEFTIDGAKVK